MQKIYRIHLSAEERDSLTALPPSFITQEITRTRLDYATEMRFISETMYPQAEKSPLSKAISTFTRLAQIYVAFEAAETRRFAEPAGGKAPEECNHMARLILS